MEKYIRYALAIIFLTIMYLETRHISVIFLGLFTFALSEILFMYREAYYDAMAKQEEHVNNTLRLAQQVNRQAQAIILHAEHIDAMQERTERRKTKQTDAKAG